MHNAQSFQGLTVNFNPMLSSAPYAKAWLYLAMDIRHASRTKLGMTAGEQYSRTGRQTANPGMLPLVHIEVPADEVFAIERYLHRKSWCQSEVHATTGSNSEWFSCPPQELANSIKHALTCCLGKGFDEDGNYDFSAIAMFPDQAQILNLACNLSGSELDHYFMALNNVRIEFGLPGLSYEAIFGLPYGQTLILGRKQE
jgi:hypothetical protein